MFGAAFALALVAHQLWWRGLPDLDLHGAVTVAAAWVLLKPGAAGRVLVLAGLEVVAVARDLPTVGDHTLLAWLTAIGLVLTAGGAVVRRRRLPTPAELWPRLAPFLRTQAVLLYGAAALAKLNTGFLDPDTSCAGPLAAQLAFFDPSLLDARWVAVAAIGLTVVTEIALAVLLAVPRTRAAGVVLGAGFHAMLALAGNVPFAAYALVLYTAFLPASTVPVLRRVAPVAGAVVAVLCLAGLVSGVVGPREEMRLVLRLVVAAGLLAVAAGVLRRHGRAPRRPAAGRVSRMGLAYGLVTVVLLLNAASPYAGGKTEASFAMFSNLQTEPGHWNHLVVPEGVRVLDAQDDLVRLVSATAPTLERRRRAGILMVRFELERYLRAHPRERATFVEVDEPMRPITASAATLEPRPVLDRVLNFYDVREGARGRC